MKKFFFFVLFTIVSMQIVVAESYQRWIYWVSPTTSHQVTPQEMAQITVLLYGKTIRANEVYSLSTGVKFKIPQPDLYLSYIEKVVKASFNNKDITKDDVVYAINDAEKMRWGNDISCTVKNYYYSFAYEKVKFIENYTGEGKDIDFLFINGKPTIKSDCGNPLENEIIEEVVPLEEGVREVVVKKDTIVSYNFKITINNTNTTQTPDKISYETQQPQVVENNYYYDDRYDYYDDNYYYYRPQRNVSGDILRYAMYEYLIYKSNSWYRVSYDTYCGWGGQKHYRQYGWKDRNYNPPYRRETRRSSGGPGGAGMNPDLGGPGGAGMNSGLGGPSGAGMNPDLGGSRAISSPYDRVSNDMRREQSAMRGGNNPLTKSGGSQRSSRGSAFGR